MTPKVSLRQFEASDATAVHRWFNNRTAIDTLMEVRESFSESEASGWVERAISTDGEDRKFAIEVAGREGPVGFTALYGIGRQTAPELGILIGDDVRGQGIGLEAERMTLERAFGEFGAHRVYARIPAHNEAHKRVVEKLGWRHEGTMRSHLRRGDQLLDCELWGVLPDEFRAATGG